jgi:DNA-binding GntR family transcriptional regulator
MPDDQADPRKYRKIMHAIRHRLDSGDIAPGAAVPSITRLAREHQCARGTASRALQELQRAGLLTRYPGTGYHRPGPQS